MTSLDLGFLSYVPHAEHDGGRGLEEGIELFELAEQLGYRYGWTRVRHFEPSLASPLPFLAAVSQRTARIRLGTAVVPVGYESPVRLAEDAATVDLLSGGRLELGVGQGSPSLAGAFGRSELPADEFADDAESRIRRLRSALGGDDLGVARESLGPVAAGDPLRLEPAAPGLAERIWYGPGTTATAERAGYQGLHIHLSTLNAEETGRGFAEQQLRQIRAYREAFERSDPSSSRRGRVAAGRIVVPIVTAADAAVHRPFLDDYERRMLPDGTPRDPRLRARYSAALSGHPEEIAAALAADVALAEADSLTITLPSSGDAAAHRRLLELVATEVAPALTEGTRVYR